MEKVRLDGKPIQKPLRITLKKDIRIMNKKVSTNAFEFRKYYIVDQDAFNDWNRRSYFKSVRLNDDQKDKVKKPEQKQVKKDDSEKKLESKDSKVSKKES